MRSLDEYKDCAVEVKGGVSKKFCFNIEGKDYFYKENFVDKDGIIYPNHIIEVLCSRILEKVGCKDFVRYDFAEFNGKFGCVSESFKTKKDIYEIYICDIMLHNFVCKKLDKKINFDENIRNEFFDELCESLDDDDDSMYGMSIDTILKDLKEFCVNCDLSFDSNQVAGCLEQAIVADYFFFNDDRNWSNILFLIDENRNLTLAPIFDNGMSFGLQRYLNTASDYMHLGFSEIGTKTTLNENNILKNYGLVVADIMQLTQNDSELNQYANNFLRLDIKKEIEDLEKEVDIDEYLKNRIVDLYQLRVNHFNLTKQKIEKRINNNFNVKNKE